MVFDTTSKGIKCTVRCLIQQAKECGALRGIGTLSIYPERPHRQCGCLACCGCTFGSRAEVALIYAMHEALRGYCP